MIRKLNVISNFITSHIGEQVIIIHILPIISRSKDSQAIKFGHLIVLIAYTVRNIFLQKSCRKCDRDTSARPPFFFKKKKKKLHVR